MKKKLLSAALIIGFAGLLSATSSYASDDLEFNHYTNKTYTGGYCYRFELKNTGTEKIEDWKIDFDLNDTKTSHFSSVFQSTDTGYQVTGLSWNSPLKVGRTTRVGFCAKGSEKPQNITISHKNSPSDYTIFQDTFTSNWINDWNLESGRTYGFENFSSLPGDILRVFYPAGSYKPSIKENIGGAAFLKKLDETGTDMYFSYDVFLEEGFDFVKGGKLPGLCGGGCPTGGSGRDDGFSARMMWRTSGDLEIYGYIQDGSEKFGTSLGRGAARLTVGKWHTITQRIKLNTPNTNDGIMEYWLDGELAYSENNMNIVSDSSIKIDAIRFETFFGGSDSSWATPVDAYTQFKNFKVWTQK
ncbi:MAG: hypothetical protein GY828_05550 [Candidatus Gracilibacteria bacterium]|nr:hypothetical protein [Candidatus Gracilibacteria bacterium]